MQQKVLVIDENETYRDALGSQLKAVGYEVISAASAANGLLQALSEFPDLIVMDLELCGITGIQAIRWLKETPRTKDIPVIVYASGQEESQREKALQVGGATVLAKPASPAVLRMVVQKVYQPESQKSPQLSTDPA